MESDDLRKAGLKVTLPRLRILEMLEHNDTSERHVTAENVYKKLLDAGEEIGLATVYRVLTQFEAAGLVKRHHFDANNSVFELDDGHHHDHLVCVKCGRVDEFEDEVIEKRQHEIVKKAGYQLTHHSHYLYGICPNCCE
ncbi:MAG: ferric iron uptake transcriptional regulator [Methylococcales bacterium]|jgi:Fur family ferric uptake transcriptional regulator